MVEIWKQIPSAPDYEASSLGQVRRRFRGVRQRAPGPLAININPGTRYPYVRIWIDGKGKNIRLNRAVCEAFYGPAPSPDHQAAHLDGVRANCRADNVKWKTRPENYLDQVAHGTSRRGEGGAMARMTEAKVLAIRASGDAVCDIANEFGIAKSTVYAIRNRGTWQHI